MQRQLASDDANRTSSTLIGSGHLYIGGHAVCAATYHLVGWGARGAAFEAFHWCGTVRRLDRGGFDAFVAREDVTLDLPEEALWWTCTITIDGWASTLRDGRMARKHEPPRAAAG